MHRYSLAKKLSTQNSHDSINDNYNEIIDNIKNILNCRSHYQIKDPKHRALKDTIINFGLQHKTVFSTKSPEDIGELSKDIEYKIITFENRVSSASIIHDEKKSKNGILLFRIRLSLCKNSPNHIELSGHFDASNNFFEIKNLAD